MAAIERSFGTTPGVMLWDGSRRAASVYSRNVGGDFLNFRVGSDDIFDIETGSRWTVDGLAIEGPLVGSRLERLGQTYQAYWGAWQAFFPQARIWGQQQGPGGSAQ